MLRVKLLGDLEYYWGDRRLNHFASRKARLVLAYLLLHPNRRHDRLHLAAQFWGDLSEIRARKALNTEIWRVCTALKQQGLDPDDYLHRDYDIVGVRHGAEYWSDVSVIQSMVQKLDTLDPERCAAADVEAISEAAQLYRGDLLEGVFDDWCLVQRDAYLAQHTKALEFLLLYHTHKGNWQAALRYGQQLLQIDSMMEHVHRAMMQCHYRIGNRPAAIRQYVLCRDILCRELGVTPMAQTERLYSALVQPKISGPLVQNANHISGGQAAPGPDGQSLTR